MNEKIFEKAEWIWTAEQYEKHEYANFIAEFMLGAPSAVLRICSKSDYAVWLNGQLVGFNQYHDFPDLKVYDEYELSTYGIKVGLNRLAVLSVAYNSNTFSKIADGKGIIFEVISDGKIICDSKADILSKLDTNYVSGEKKIISPQLGYSFKYNFNNKSDWINCDSDGFTLSKVCAQKTSFMHRPISRLEILPAVYGECIDKAYHLYDYGRVMAGYLSFTVEAESACELVVSYGEHIKDGSVRRLIHNRDFSAVFILKKGINEFNEYFLRFGLRYLQFTVISAQAKILKAGIRESVYPIRPYAPALEGIDKDIYNISVNTLHACMHEHYEDCPWREQAMYCMDGRSELLCTYLAFGETRFPRAALTLMIHRLTADGLIPMTAPSSGESAITSFNFVYFLALKEYLDYSGDLSILDEVGDKAERVIDGFISKIKDGLIYEQHCWNFIEWSDGLEDRGYFEGDCERLKVCAFTTNAWFVIALNSYAQILDLQKKDNTKYIKIRDSILEKLKGFYSHELGLYSTYLRDGTFYHLAEYTQFIALYAGVAAHGSASELISRALANENLVKMSLASYIFRYEVLLKNNMYNSFVISEVRRTFGSMLNSGATTFWETEKGEADFDGAGSLCHGWSAIPIYVYHKLKML